MGKTPDAKPEDNNFDAAEDFNNDAAVNETATQEGGRVTLKKVYQTYAEKGTKKEPHEVDIIARHKVKFIAPFKGIPVDSERSVSTVMKDLYLANNVIEILDVDKNDVEVKTKVDKDK